MMGHFLRDQQLSNLSLTEDTLIQISSVFSNRDDVINANIPEDDATGKRAFFTYIIRFDNKGYRVFSLHDLLRYFHQANKLERVCFTVETGESLRSSRQVGTYLELRLDEKDPNNCVLIVTSDNGDWVNASFSAVQDVLAKYKNKNGWARTAWTRLGLQILGVSFGFVLSLWVAETISPKLAIENSFIISFLFVLLLFSNTWMYLNERIISFINAAFPNLKFVRPGKDRMHWITQAIIGGIAAAVALYVLHMVFSYVGDILGGFVRKGAVGPPPG